MGVAPTPISTHMVNAIGLRHTRRYALTGERFNAKEAERIGLIHEVVAESEIETKLAAVLDAIFLGSPSAIAMTKGSFLVDEADAVWLFLHSGSRGIGNKIAQHHIAVAQRRAVQERITLPDRDLAYLAEGTDEFAAYLRAEVEKWSKVIKGASITLD